VRALAGTIDENAPGESIWSETAAWVEAIGAIAAVIGSGWVAARGSRAARRREERAEAAAVRKEERGLLATKTATLNLAILASTQIHDLHVLLVDEAWRGRVTRVSASRALLATERMLTAFPIQSLSDAPAMVEFSRFPASLATAAEIYEISKPQSGPRRNPSAAPFSTRAISKWPGWTAQRSAG
jgi:hypothetical protein